MRSSPLFQPGQRDWRLTFAASAAEFDEETLGIITRETAPKRFTFLLGPDQPVRTAEERLGELAQKAGALTLDDVEQAFSVERLNKEFFKQYKEHYQRFTSHLIDETDAPESIFDVKVSRDSDEFERACKLVRDFVKRLLGRIVFLHFLQRKGWLGCEPGRKDWSDGDRDFMRHYFERAERKNEAEAFHSKWLTPLFFDALNNAERPDDLFEPTGTRIPYLNGGLFEETLPAARRIDFPREYFRDLINFFSHYNFTIDENDPEENEIGIDPEMLGHIFENLLEDNKDKGAYYTPKAIVQYMCQQALLHYLRTHLGEHDDLDRLVIDKNAGDRSDAKSWIRQHGERIERLIDHCKICDPAVGSGAFPIGMLTEMLQIKLALDLTLGPHDAYEEKKKLIQNCLHGVDIDPGAIEIARLRFWLALVVDAQEPEPLPNLDYKLMQGDSLLESFEGIDLSRIASGVTFEVSFATGLDPQGELAMDEAIQQQDLRVRKRREDISALIQRYYHTNAPEEKNRLHAEIDRLVLDHIHQAVEFRRDELTSLIDQQQKMLKGEFVRSNRNWSEKKAEKRIVALRDELSSLSETERRLHALHHTRERPFFLWRLYFQNVFENGGFDVVIENPPYVRQESIKEYKTKLKEYRTYTGTADLFVYFYERSVELLRKEGAISIITSNKYYRSAYGRKLRDFLAKKLTLHTLVDFGDAPVFDAIAYASILIGTKQEPSHHHSVRVYTWQQQDQLPLIVRVLEDDAFRLPQEKLTADGWRLEPPEVHALLEKLRGKGTPLGKYVNGRFYRGILTGLNEAFVIDEATKDRLISEDPKSAEIIKPFLRGKDVKRWRAEHRGYYLIKIESSENKRHPWSGKKPAEAEQIFAKTWPAIHRWFQQFRDKLIKRYDQGRFYWELRSCAYWKEYECQQIAWGNLATRPQFGITSPGCCVCAPAVSFTSSENWLASILNSKICHYVASQHAAARQGGFVEFKPMYISPLTIPPASDADKAKLSELAEACQEAAKAGDTASLNKLEAEIDQIVYRLFELTEEEIQLIEESTAVRC